MNILSLADLMDDQEIFGVFRIKRNNHKQLFVVFETEDEAINYIKEKCSDDMRLCYSKLKRDDVHYWLCEYDKK